MTDPKKTASTLKELQNCYQAALVLAHYCDDTKISAGRCVLIFNFCLMSSLQAYTAALREKGLSAEAIKDDYSRLLAVGARLPTAIQALEEQVKQDEAAAALVPSAPEDGADWEIAGALAESLIKKATEGGDKP